MPLILGVDFETSGLDVTNDRIVEVGAAVWDTDLQTPIQLTGYLVHHPGLKLHPDIFKINGLTEEILSKYGTTSEKGIRKLLLMMRDVDYVCAHNGSHLDKPMFQKWCELENYEFPDKLWLDTQTDIELPAKMSRRLTYLAADHGFLNPFPHRALFDTMTMLRVLAHYDINQVIFLAKTPNLLIEALVPFERKDEAKERGFYFESPPAAPWKRWVRIIKECYLEKFRAEYPFEIRVLETPKP